MKALVFFITVLSTSFSFAQDCSKEILRQKPGTWKAGMAGQIVGVTPADLAKEKAVIGNIHKMVTTGFAPKGCEITYARVYGKNDIAGQRWMGDPYSYHLYVLRYLCDPGSADKSKWYVDYATPTTVSVTINELLYLSTLYAADLPADEFRGYLKLTQRPVKKDGVWFMGEEVVGDYGRPSEIREYRWLITYGDTLPFTYLNRKEYLLIQKKRLEKDLIDSPGDKNWTNTFIRNVDEYLKKPESELNKPAICMWNEEQRFEKFVDEGTYGSFIAIKPNLAYYKKLPKSSPQFISVVYKVAKGDPVFDENIEGIKKAIDFARLKSMLGK